MGLSIQCHSRLNRSIEQILIAASQETGQPCMGVARHVALMPDGSVSVEGRFNPEVFSCARENSRVALVVWDHDANEGFQVLGKVARVDRPRLQEVEPVPEGRFIVEVGRVVGMGQADSLRALL